MYNFCNAIGHVAGFCVVIRVMFCDRSVHGVQSLGPGIITCGIITISLALCSLLWLIYFRFSSKPDFRLRLLQILMKIRSCIPGAS